MEDWEAESDIHCRFIITHITAVYCMKPAFRAYTMIHTHRTLLTLPQYPALLADLCHVYENLILKKKKSVKKPLNFRGVNRMQSKTNESNSEERDAQHYFLKKTTFGREQLGASSLQY